MDRNVVRYFSSLGFAFILCPAAFAYLEVGLQKFEQIEADAKIMDWSDLKIRKENRTRKLFGQQKYFIPFGSAVGNEFQVEANFYTKQGGEYRKLPYKIKKQNACDFYKDDKYFYPELAAASDLPKPFKCPVANKTYTIKGFYPMLKNAPMALLRNGDYKFELILFKSDKIALKMALYLDNINI